MADVVTLNAEQQVVFDAWLAGRPPVVAEVVRERPPMKLYRLKTTGQRVVIQSYHEDRTVTVFVSRNYNAVVFECEVFGVYPEELEECDLPGPDEVLGAALTTRQQIDAYIDAVRPILLAGRDGVGIDL